MRKILSTILPIATVLAIGAAAPIGFGAAPATAAPAGNFYTRLRANDAPIGGRFTVFGYFLDSLDVAVPPPAGIPGRPLLLLIRDGSGDDAFLVPGDLALEDARGRRLVTGLNTLPPGILGGRIGHGDRKVAVWWVPNLGERWGWDSPSELHLAYGFTEKPFVPLDDKDLDALGDVIPWDLLGDVSLDPDRPVAQVAWTPDPFAFDEAPTIREFIPPRYPDSAKRYDFKGTVRVVAELDVAGNVLDAFVVQSGAAHDLNIAALVAVSRWRFNPGRKAGQAVAGDVLVPIEFTDAEN